MNIRFSLPCGPSVSRVSSPSLITFLEYCPLLDIMSAYFLLRFLQLDASLGEEKKPNKNDFRAAEKEKHFYAPQKGSTRESPLVSCLAWSCLPLFPLHFHPLGFNNCLSGGDASVIGMYYRPLTKQRRKEQLCVWAHRIP